MSLHLLFSEVPLNELFLCLNTKLAEDNRELLAESASLRWIIFNDRVTIFYMNLNNGGLKASMSTKCLSLLIFKELLAVLTDGTRQV